MTANDEALSDILDIASEIENIILLELDGLKGTWKQHIEDIDRKILEIKAICGDEEASELVKSRKEAIEARKEAIEAYRTRRNV